MNAAFSDGDQSNLHADLSASTRENYLSREGCSDRELVIERLVVKNVLKFQIKILALSETPPKDLLGSGNQPPVVQLLFVSGS